MADDQHSVNLQPLWQGIYGFGPKFYARHIANSRRRMQAILHGNQGTTLTLELWNSDALRSVFVYGSDFIGVAQDSKGDTYKVTGPAISSEYQ